MKLAPKPCLCFSSNRATYHLSATEVLVFGHRQKPPPPLGGRPHIGKGGGLWHLTGNANYQTTIDGVP